MKVYKKDDKLIFEFPFWTKRSNPYMPENVNCGEYPTLVGLVTKDQWGYEELGFAQVIDMDYKGKDDQIGGIIIHYNNELKKFEKLCKKLKLGIYYL